MSVKITRVTITASKKYEEPIELCVWDDMPEIAGWWFFYLYPEEKYVFNEDELPWFISPITITEINKLRQDIIIMLGRKKRKEKGELKDNEYIPLFEKIPKEWLKYGFSSNDGHLEAVVSDIEKLFADMQVYKDWELKLSVRKVWD